jgi:methionine-rich copper-binding protein CopC
MSKRGIKKGNVLLISVVLFSIILVGLFAEGSWAQAPTVVLQSPADQSLNVLINTNITIQFDMTMNTGASWIDVWDEYDQDVAGTIQWTTTTYTNDTLVFIPQNALRPATGYAYQGMGQAATGSAYFWASFITKYAYADTTPPTVQTVYPYNGMTNVWTGQTIHIVFSEAMNPDTINSTNITISGLSSSDYSVTVEDYDSGCREADIRKNTAFSASTPYTVTITTNVRDMRGNPLKTAYSWSFTTGATDSTHPTVTQTIPASSDTNVSLYPALSAIFSKKMDETTLTTTNITLYDNNTLSYVPITIYESELDLVMFAPQSALTYGHQYTATIGTGVKDGAGNPLSVPYSWSFTTAANSGIDSDPILNWGVNSDNQLGQRWFDGTTRVQFELGAWDDITSSLTVTAATSGHSTWSLTGSGGDYEYNSTGDEGLSNGTHLVTFTIQDGAANTVSFQRNIYIFSTRPALSSPANGATGVSTTPTFQWSYSGTDRPMYYNVAVFDGPDINTARMVWMDYMVDMGSDVTHSITIPADKQLAPNTTYYWGVRGANDEENGETYRGLWPFTTGGTPPPAPQILWAYVQSDDIYPPAVQGSLLVKIRGPSPADIVELKVTGPGGYQYIFTEDDLATSEELGQYYMVNFSNTLSNGTYTFSLTDSVGRTVTTTRNYTFVSLPKVDYNTMAPVDNTYVNSTTPTLSWGSVGAGYYYRVVIRDWNANQRPVFMSKYTQNTSVTVPVGYLFSNIAYKWRVDVYDTDASQDNRSRSNDLRFSTGSSSYTPANMIQWVNFYNENSNYTGLGKMISVGVLGPLPNHVTSFNVTGSDLNYDFLETDVMYNLASQNVNMYTNWESGGAAGGDYTFNLVTPLGSDSTVKNLTPSTIPIVDQATMSPANNTYLTNLTPTLTWGSVTGSPRYYRVMIQDWKRRYVVYVSARSTDLSAAIPAGVLKAGRSYMWRVEVFDDQNGSVADNRSTSAWNCFTTPRRWMIDFGGDEFTDITIYRSSTGVWWIIPSSGAPAYGVGLGGDVTNDRPVPGDYDGDGKTDTAIYRSNWGAWYIIPSSTGVMYGVGWGGDPNDKPVPGDYDGDGKTDIAIYRSHWGAWYIIPSSTGVPYGVGLGGDVTNDKLVPGDYDGDGKTDIAIYRSHWGAWYIIPSSTGVMYGVGLGGDVTNDKPVPGDYDGDGKTDIAIYRSHWGAWYIIPSSTGVMYGVGLGGDVTNDKPVPGDYDGDGKTDIAIYRSNWGAWYILPSLGGDVYGVGWGGDSSDLPVTLNLASTY